MLFFLGCGTDFPQKLSAALWWKPSSLKSQKHRQLLYSQKLHDSSNPEQAPLPPFQKCGSTARMRGAFDQQDKSALRWDRIQYCIIFNETLYCEKAGSSLVITCLIDPKDIRIFYYTTWTNWFLLFINQTFISHEADNLFYKTHWNHTHDNHAENEKTVHSVIVSPSGHVSYVLIFRLIGENLI